MCFMSEFCCIYRESFFRYFWDKILGARIETPVMKTFEC